MRDAREKGCEQKANLEFKEIFIFFDMGAQLYYCTELSCTVLYCAVLCCAVLYCAVLYCVYLLYCTVLYCTVLCCAVLYCTVLYCTVLTVLYCIVLYCTVLYCTVLCCAVLYCTVLCCTVLCCAVLCCAVLYCTVLCCTVLYCTVLYCAVLYCAVLYCAVLYCTVLYCTVLYCAVLCCDVLYFTVLCCTVLCCTVLCCAVLYCAVLCCAVLCCAVLCCAVLYCTVLYCTVLYCAVLYCTVLCCAVLCCAVLCCTVLRRSGTLERIEAMAAPHPRDSKATARKNHGKNHVSVAGFLTSSTSKLLGGLGAVSQQRGRSYSSSGDSDDTNNSREANAAKAMINSYYSPPKTGVSGSDSGSSSTHTSNPPALVRANSNPDRLDVQSVGTPSRDWLPSSPVKLNPGRAQASSKLQQGVSASSAASSIAYTIGLTEEDPEAKHHHRKSGPGLSLPMDFSPLLTRRRPAHTRAARTQTSTSPAVNPSNANTAGALLSDLGGGEKDGTSAWTLSLALQASFKVHSGCTTALYAHSTRGLFASAGRDSIIKVWSLGLGSGAVHNPISYREHRLSSSVSSVELLPEQSRAVSLAEDLHVWDLEVGKTLCKVTPDSLIGNLSLSSNHTRQGAVARVSFPSVNALGRVQCFKALPERGSVLMGTHRGRLHFLDMRWQHVTRGWRIQRTSSGERQVLRCLATDPSHHWLATGTVSGYVALLDSRTGLVHHLWKAHDGAVLCLVPAGSKRLLSSGLDRTLCLWSLGHAGRPPVLIKKFTGLSDAVHTLTLHHTDFICGVGHRIGLGSLEDDTPAEVRVASLRASGPSASMRHGGFGADVQKKAVLTSVALLPTHRYLLIGTEEGRLLLSS
eukprot:g81144.t1